MKIDRAGFPFIAAALIPALVALSLGQALWAIPFVVLAGFFTYFFRDPERRVPDTPGLVVSPADGRVLVAGPAAPGTSPPGEWLQISIFLSPMDVHINRAPVAGVVTRIDYQPGSFLPAYRAEASRNERTEISIDHGGDTVVVRQIVGVLARRVVCRLREGQTVSAGERLGLMKFGSRMDVFVPPTADLRARVGDRVRGGESVLAVLKSGG
jgi:phosphatidylserine decarboxylase